MCGLTICNVNRLRDVREMDVLPENLMEKPGNIYFSILVDSCQSF